MEVIRGKTNRGVFSQEKGFTLLELLLVVFLISLLFGILLPRLPGITEKELDFSSRYLANTIRFLYDSAITQKKYFILRYDLDKKTYRPYVKEGEEFIPYSSDGVGERHLPESVRFLEVHVAGKGVVSAGETDTLFTPYGMAEKTLIHLEGEGDEKRTLLITPSTGKVRILAGLYEEEV